MEKPNVTPIMGGDVHRQAHDGDAPRWTPWPACRDYVRTGGWTYRTTDAPVDCPKCLPGVPELVEES